MQLVWQKNAGKRDLVSNKRVHTGEKTFNSPKCLSSFSESSNLGRHMVTHSRIERQITEQPVSGSG